MWTLLLESTCALHASDPAGTLRELRSWLRGMAASTASAIGARTRAGASRARRQGAVVICGSQGLRLGGCASSSPARLWEPLASPSVRGGGEQRQPGPHTQGRGLVRCSMEQHSGLCRIPTEGECGKNCWESRSLVPLEPGAERQLKHEPPGNTRAGFNSVRAA